MAIVATSLIPGRPGLVVQAGLAIYSIFTAKDPSEAAGSVLVGIMLGGIVGTASRNTAAGSVSERLGKSKSAEPVRGSGPDEKVSLQPGTVEEAKGAVKLQRRRLEGALGRLDAGDRQVLGDVLEEHGHPSPGSRPTSTPEWVPGEQERQVAGLRKTLQDLGSGTAPGVVELLPNEVRAELGRLLDAGRGSRPGSFGTSANSPNAYCSRTR